jgi:CHASE3 domain sensor protein
MRNFEIVVSPQEVKDKEAARKQTQIVLAVAGLIIMLALIAQKLGFGS